MKEFDLVLEDFDKLYDAAVAYIESTVKRKDPGVVLWVKVKLGDIFGTDEEARILCVGIHGWNNLASANGEGTLSNGESGIITVVVIKEAVPTNGTQVSFDLNIVKLGESLSE
jgi:hypothetical protein